MVVSLKKESVSYFNDRRPKIANFVLQDLWMWPRKDADERGITLKRSALSRVNPRSKRVSYHDPLIPHAEFIVRHARLVVDLRNMVKEGSEKVYKL
jgi:hypothetical protein